MKSLTHIHFGNQVPRTGVPIAHVMVDPITAHDAIVLVDTSNIIPQNSFFEKNIEISLTEDNLTYFLDKNGFRITDRFTKSDKPLFYRHDLQSPILTNAQGGSDIIVIDALGNTISTDYWDYDPGKKVVYHALSFEILGDAIFYVKYSKADENNLLIDRQHKELLTGGSAFHEAVSIDVLPDGCLNPDSDAYLIEERDGQPYYWRITLPRSGKYSLKYTQDGLLKLNINNIPQSEPWYIGIQNAVVLTKNLVENQLLRYTIGEFDLQSFYPFPPIKLNTLQKARKLSEYVIDTTYKHLIYSTKTPIDILIFNVNNVLLYALTTDQNKSSKFIHNVSWDVDSIESIDVEMGRISLRHSLKAGETAYVSFYYKDNIYEYTGINLNPLYNPDILDQRVAILCKPDIRPINTTISHVLLTKEEVILEATDPDIQAWLTPGKTFNDLKTDWLFIPSAGINNQNNYALLGITTTAIPLGVKDISITDARRFCGVPDDLQEQAINDIPGISQFWDIMDWDGPGIPVNGAVLVYLPSWIANIYTEDELRARTKRFIPAGSILIFKYY
jgi:hypothetical protein